MLVKGGRVGILVTGKRGEVRETYGVHQEVSVVLAVSLMFDQVMGPKTQNVPMKYAPSSAWEMR